MKRIELENGNYRRIVYYDDKDTKIMHDMYYNKNDYIHNLYGPAEIKYYKSGKIEAMQYCINRKRHRLNGPAMIWYNRSGEIEHAYYYINGKSYSKEEFYKRPEVIKFRNINRNLKLLNKK